MRKSRRKWIRWICLAAAASLVLVTGGVLALYYVRVEAFGGYISIRDVQGQYLQERADGSESILIEGDGKYIQVLRAGGKEYRREGEVSLESGSNLSFEGVLYMICDSETGRGLEPPRLEKEAVDTLWRRDSRTIHYRVMDRPSEQYFLKVTKMPSNGEKWKEAWSFFFGNVSGCNRCS